MANGIYAKGRRCTSRRNGKRCITILHTSNPGPMCEWHTAVARGEQQRRRVLERFDKTQFAAAA
jgi:hypothetical protein